MNINDKSNPNVPENDQNWVEIVVMAIIFTQICFVYILIFADLICSHHYVVHAL